MSGRAKAQQAANKQQQQQKRDEAAMQEEFPFDDEESENEHSATEQQNQIATGSSSSTEMILKFKVGELQKICATLNNANKKLLSRVQEMQEAMEAMENQKRGDEFETHDEETQLNQITQIESNLLQWKSSLQKYRESIVEELKRKEQMILSLNGQISNLGVYIERIQNQNNLLTKSNEQLQQSNDNLLAQLQSLQASSREPSASDYTPSKSLRYKEAHYDRYDYEGEFDVSVQMELQRLIEKLVKELQFQRNQKRKMGEEIKRCQRQMMQLERQLKTKNNKIYMLELNSLKNARPTESRVSLISKEKEYKAHDRHPVHQKSHDKSIKHSNSQEYLQKPKQYPPSPVSSKIMGTYSLMQLMNQKISLSLTSKLIIANKIVDYYIKKINNEDFVPIGLQALTLHNFTPINPNLLTIRKDANIVTESMTELPSESKLIWNLGFLLDNLLNQTMEKPSDIKGQREERILSSIRGILQREQRDAQDIYDLKRSIQQAIKNRRGI